MLVGRIDYDMNLKHGKQDGCCAFLIGIAIFTVTSIDRLREPSTSDITHGFLW